MATHATSLRTTGHEEAPEHPVFPMEFGGDAMIAPEEYDGDTLPRYLETLEPLPWIMGHVPHEPVPDETHEETGEDMEPFVLNHFKGNIWIQMISLRLALLGFELQ